MPHSPAVEDKTLKGRTREYEVVLDISIHAGSRNKALKTGPLAKIEETQVSYYCLKDHITRHAGRSLIHAGSRQGFVLQVWDGKLLEDFYARDETLPPVPYCHTQLCQEAA